MCPACFNGDIKHDLRRVIFPDAEKIRAIDAALILRPLKNRNWQEPETIEILLKDNEEHKEELLTWLGPQQLINRQGRS